MVGGRVARSQPMAAAGAADGHPLCPWASHRDQLAPRQRNQRRLRRLFLLPRQPRTQDRIGRYATFSAPPADLATARPAALAVIDDSPTKRYGPKVEGAAIPKKRGWKFRTKLDLAAQLLEWIVPLVKKAGKTLWVVVDGGYTKVPFLKRAAAAGVVVVGRLRKDAALRTLPPSLRRGQRPGRGRPRKYGKHKISLAKRAGQKRGWRTVDCTIYGKTVTKIFKTFLATYRPAGGVIRVVIVQEEHGWFAFFCTDPTASVVEILEAFADRAAIEVELWAWRRRHGTLCDRRDSPWDDAERRPSHADRRKALRQHIMPTELSTITATWSLPRKILRLAQRLMALAI